MSTIVSKIWSSCRASMFHARDAHWLLLLKDNPLFIVLPTVRLLRSSYVALMMYQTTHGPSPCLNSTHKQTNTEDPKSSLSESSRLWLRKSNEETEVILLDHPYDYSLKKRF